MTLHANYHSQYDHHVINYSWARRGEGRGTIGIWESGSGQGYVSWCSNSRVMFKEVARKVQRGRSVRLRNLCAVSLILRLQGQELLHKLGTLVRPGLYSKIEREKTGLTIVHMPCNSFVSPNSALSPNSCIFFFGLDWLIRVVTHKDFSAKRKSTTSVTWVKRQDNYF